MLAYPCRLEPDEGGFLVTCRDVDGILTWGETRAMAEAMAADAIATQLSRAPALQDWPAPSPTPPDEVLVVLPPLLAAKTALRVAMTEAGLDHSGLARRLGVSETAARRLLNFRYRSRIDLIEQALAALGKRLVVEVRRQPRRTRGHGFVSAAPQPTYRTFLSSPARDIRSSSPPHLISISIEPWTNETPSPPSPRSPRRRGSGCSAS
jgi:antitoxin HicB